MPDASLPDDEYKLMATLSDLADRELVATIGWAKQVPGQWCMILSSTLVTVCVILSKHQVVYLEEERHIPLQELPTCSSWSLSLSISLSLTSICLSWLIFFSISPTIISPFQSLLSYNLCLLVCFLPSLPLLPSFLYPFSSLLPSHQLTSLPPPSVSHHLPPRPSPYPISCPPIQLDESTLPCPRALGSHWNTVCLFNNRRVLPPTQSSVVVQV